MAMDCITVKAASSCPLMDGPAVLRPRQQARLARGVKDEEHAMSPKLNAAIAVIGIDIGKNSFHVVGLDRGAIVLRLANLPPCSATASSRGSRRKRRWLMGEVVSRPSRRTAEEPPLASRLARCL